MFVWYFVTFAVTTSILLVVLIHEVRLRLRDLERIDNLLFQLNASHAEQTRLCREKTELELRLRTAQQSYIFDLPTHIPGSHGRFPN